MNWRALIDGFLAVAVIYMGALIARPAFEIANRNAQIEIVSHEAGVLYDAFQRYHESNRAYPSTYSRSAFEPDTLDPLRRRGYYRGPIVANLLDHRVDAYDSPDDQGPNREFWLEMSLETDPSIRLLVARSDDAPLGGGQWREGVFIFRNGTLERL